MSEDHVQVTYSDGLWYIHSIRFSNVEAFVHEENARLDAALWDGYFNINNWTEEKHDTVVNIVTLWEAMKKICEERGVEL